MKYSNIYKKTFGVLTLLVSLLFWGCTKENLFDCEKGVWITFNFSNANSEVHFSQGLTQMNLYVFDKDGLFFEQHKTENISDKRSGTILLDLPAGRYTVVSWGNLSTDYQIQPLIKGVSKLSDAQLSLVRSDGKITKRLTSLYHGLATEIEVIDNESAHSKIELINDAKVFHITLKGLIRAEGVTTEQALLQYPVYIEDDNGDYKFDNTLASTTPLTYIPSYKVVGKNIVVEAVILRIFQGGPTTLVFENNRTRGKNQFKYNLMEQILKSPIKDQIGLDDCDYYDIEIEIDDTTSATSTIKINGWIVFVQEQELG